MRHDTRESRAEPAALLPWGSPASEAGDGPVSAVASWIGGGTLLAVWTGLSLLLTSA